LSPTIRWSFFSLLGPIRKKKKKRRRRESFSGRMGIPVNLEVREGREGKGGLSVLIEGRSRRVQSILRQESLGEERNANVFNDCCPRLA
jgi:hypothetical protein